MSLKRRLMMSNAFALMKRILQQFRHDPRTIVMFIVAPVLVLWLFSVLLGGSGYKPKLAGVDLPDEIVTVMKGQDAIFEEMDAVSAADRLARQEIDAVVTLKDGVLSIKVEGTDASRTGAVMSVINTVVQEVAANQREKISSELRDKLETMITIIDQIKTGLSAVPNAPVLPDFPKVDDLEFQMIISDIELSYLHGSDDWNSFDFFGPVFIGIFIFVFVFITSGMSLITERTGGTMERLLATPIKPWQLVLGFCLGFGLVSLIQAALVLWACITLVGFPNEGSLFTVITITFSLALVSLTLGLLVSGLARTPLQVIQFMLILVIPQVLLSGIFDLAQSPGWMQVLNRCFPITYGAEALRDIMLRGASLPDIGTQLAILWAFIAVFFLLATLSFAKRRTS